MDYVFAYLVSMKMYLYQDYLRLGEALRNEMEMRKRKDKENGEMVMWRMDKKSGEKCSKSPLDVKTGISVDGAYLSKSGSVLNSNETFQSDTPQMSDSFNPFCSICSSNVCTSAFNPKFKTCLHHAKPQLYVQKTF